jgi:unsaturated rhamnogalacturonyl hydrolase
LKSTLPHRFPVRPIAFGLASLAALNQARAADPSAGRVAPSAVLASMEKAADWQLAHPKDQPATGWIQASGYTGIMALSGISRNPKYVDAMRSMGEANKWQLGPRIYNADDYCVGQTYAELYLRFRNPDMIAPLRDRFDAILARPPQSSSLDFATKDAALENWSWCDSLFMGPPAWVRLYSATGDTRYLDFAVEKWWRATDYLYDREEHLFFRDSTYFKRREANGQKVFWGRGNGWVMAGLVRTLEFLPGDHPDRPRFVRLFKDMADRIVSLQQPDGLWRSSLLDPASYPLKEASGSGFYVYALAWGMNNGLLDRAQFGPAVFKGWAQLASCLAGDGKLTHVQPVGADPKRFPEDSTEAYGVGAFLLAGSEVYKAAN